MDRVDDSGAIATAEHFLDLYTYAVSSLSKKEFKAISADACVFCNSVLKKVDERVEAGTHDIGGEMTYSAATALHSDQNTYLVELTAVQRPSKTVTKTGSVVTNFPNTITARMNILVRRTPNGWLVREGTVLSSQKKR